MKTLLLAFILLLICDFIWLTWQKPMYQLMVYKVQFSDLHINLPGALIAYFLMFVSIAYIILPLVKNLKITTYKDAIIASLRYGGILGLVIYGIYNATNYAIFKNYSAKAAIIDTLWGITIYSFITFIIINGQFGDSIRKTPSVSN
jgi:uncharacterized membrane protein